MSEQQKDISEIIQDAKKEAEFLREHRERIDKKTREAIRYFNEQLGYVFLNVMAETKRRLNKVFDLRGEERHGQDILDFTEAAVASAMASCVANFSKLCRISDDFPQEAALSFLRMISHDEPVHFVIPRQSDLEKIQKEEEKEEEQETK